MKKILLISVLFLVSLWSYSEEWLIVNKTNEDTIAISFTEQPTIKFDVDSFYVYKDALLFTSFDRAQVTNICFETEPPLPTDITTTKQNSTIKFADNNTIRVSDNVPASQISLYSVKGHRVPVSIEGENNYRCVRLGGLQPDIYILKISGQSYKFMKK